LKIIEEIALLESVILGILYIYDHLVDMMGQDLDIICTVVDDQLEV